MQIFHINHIFHKATKNYPSVIALQKKYQLSSQTVDIIEITSDLHRHEGVDQEYTAVYFLTTKCRGLHVCSMKLGTYMFHLTFVLYLNLFFLIMRLFSISITVAVSFTITIILAIFTVTVIIAVFPSLQIQTINNSTQVR